MVKWHEWETPWRSFEQDGRRFRMKVQYGLDQVNNPPVFHFNHDVEEKLRNNRWQSAGTADQNPLHLFPELSFAAKWADFRPGPRPLYLDNAHYWWEYAHGHRKPGQYDERHIAEKAGPRFARTIFLGNLPGDEIGPENPDNWAYVRRWLEERHPRLLAAFEADYSRMPVDLQGSGQQDTLKLLPPGVRKVIKAHAERIQAAVEGRILWNQVLGCGHYGCVVPIEGTDKVLKVTTDKTEGPVVQAIMNTGLDKSLGGLIAWWNVWQIPDYEGRGARASAYAIVRDAIEPLNEDLVTFGSGWMDALHEYNLSARRALTLKRPDMIERETDKAKDAVQKLYRWNETWLVAEAIEALESEGIVLADVHFRNLGAGKKSPEVIWKDGERRPALLIFDPGHSQAPPTDVPMLP